jgi:hypothetical protein
VANPDQVVGQIKVVFSFVKTCSPSHCSSVQKWKTKSRRKLPESRASRCVRLPPYIECVRLMACYSSRSGSARGKKVSAKRETAVFCFYYHHDRMYL